MHPCSNHHQLPGLRQRHRHPPPPRSKRIIPTPVGRDRKVLIAVCAMFLSTLANSSAHTGSHVTNCSLSYVHRRATPSSRKVHLCVSIYAILVAILRGRYMCLSILKQRLTLWNKITPHVHPIAATYYLYPDNCNGKCVFRRFDPEVGEA